MQVQDNSVEFVAAAMVAKGKVKRGGASGKSRHARGLGSVYQTNGRWTATLPRPGQRPLKFTAKTQAEAINKRANAQEAITLGVLTSDGKRQLLDGARIVTVADWLNYWVEHMVKPVYDARGQRVSGGQPTTYQNYRYQMDRNVIPYLGAIKLADLRTSHVETWFKSRIAAGVGPVAMANALRYLTTALNRAMERRAETGLTWNAAALFKVRKPTNEAKAEPDPSAIQKILAAGAGSRFEIVLHLGWALGLRRQEIAALQFGDFDLERGVLLIRRRACRLAGYGVLVRNGAKMKDDNEVQELPLGDIESWRQLLSQQRARVLDFAMEHRKTWALAGSPVSETSWLFPNIKGEVADPYYIVAWFKATCAQAGYPDKIMHSMRHDYAGVLADLDVPLLQISRLLRHTDTAVTDRVYTHLIKERHQAVNAKVASYLTAGRVADGTTG
jgi:integrase